MVDLDNGTLSLDVHDEHGKPVKKSIHVFLSQNVASLGAQYRISTKGGDDDVRGEFPPGSYTAQVFADGYDVARLALTVAADRTTHETVRLKTRETFPKPTLEERLAVYNLSRDQLQSFEVKEGQHVVLDYRTYPIAAHFTVIHPKTITDIKRMVGAPDEAFAPGVARFGQIPHGDGQHQLEIAAREFVYGNSQVVTNYGDILNRRLLSQGALIQIPIFFFFDITIYEGGILEIGSGSSVFFADTLTVYPTGTLLVTGDVRSDIGLYQQL